MLPLLPRGADSGHQHEIRFHDHGTYGRIVHPLQNVPHHLVRRSGVGDARTGPAGPGCIVLPPLPRDGRRTRRRGGRPRTGSIARGFRAAQQQRDVETGRGRRRLHHPRRRVGVAVRLPRDGSERRRALQRQHRRGYIETFRVPRGGQRDQGNKQDGVRTGHTGPTQFAVDKGGAAGDGGDGRADSCGH